MHGVNLDLLRATAAHNPDGTAKNPHAHHRAEHLFARRSARRAFFRLAFARILQWVAPKKPRLAQAPCPDARR